MSNQCRVLRVMFCLLAAGSVGGPVRCEEPKPDRAATLADLKKYDCGGIDDTTDASVIKRMRFGCHSKLPNSALSKLAAFPELENLSFISDKVTDDGLSHLKHLPKLRMLQINSSTITDKGLESLKDLPNLEELTLMRTQVTEKGLAKVHAVRGLKSLRLIRLNVTPGMIEQLKRLNRLDRVYISQTTFTDEQKRELTTALANLSIN